MSWKRKQKPKFPCPYCGKKHYHLCDALLCADLQKVYKMNQIKIIKKKLRSMRFSEKEVKKQTENLERKEIIKQSFQKSFIVIVENVGTAYVILF